MYVESRITLEGFNKREIQVLSHKRSACEVITRDIRYGYIRGHSGHQVIVLEWSILFFPE